MLFRPRFELLCLLFLLFCKRGILYFGNIRFFLQLNAEEIVLFKRERKFVARHSRAFDQLVVGNDLPVVSDDSYKTALRIFGVIFHRNVKSHVGGKSVNGLNVCSQNFRYRFGFDHAPVTPNEKLLSCRKIRIFGNDFRSVRQGKN